MKAQELRIGNLVKRGDDTCVVSLLRRSHFNACNLKLGVGYGNSHQSNYQPIPLTEEWLLRMGFISNPYQDRYENEVIQVECNKTRGVTELWIDKMPHIKYVHQLQNLYFALTGEELIHDEWVVTKDNYPSIVDILKENFKNK